MSTIVVWVLIFNVWSAPGSGPAVVDNIASRDNCEALAKAINTAQVGGQSNNSYVCVAVRKVVPK